MIHTNEKSCLDSGCLLVFIGWTQNYAISYFFRCIITMKLGYLLILRYLRTKSFSLRLCGS